MSLVNVLVAYINFMYLDILNRIMNAMKGVWNELTVTIVFCIWDFSISTKEVTDLI